MSSPIVVRTRVLFPVVFSIGLAVLALILYTANAQSLTAVEDKPFNSAVENADQVDTLVPNSDKPLTWDLTWDPESRMTYSIAWGDVDGDGDLDLLVGNSDQPNQLYRNDKGFLMLDTAWNPITSTTQGVAWGDVDGDGDLDLLVGNAGQPNQLYRNHGGTLTLDPAWNPITRTTSSVAWGDVDSDGDLDLVVGNYDQPNQLYRNTGGILTLDTAWNPESYGTDSVAWGDVDGDGDLDLLVGNFGDPNQLYLNNGRTLSLDTAWNPESRYTTSVVWGDVDGDGDLDLLVGNSYAPNQLYRIVEGTLELDTAWYPEPRDTQGVVWGDVDGDGDLDLLVGNRDQPSQLYRNTDGILTLDTAWNPEPRGTESVAWGDVDGDGDLDLLVGNSYTSNQLYRNTGGTPALDTTWIPEPHYTNDVAWGDVDGDGDLDLVVAGNPNRLYRNDRGTLTLDTAWNPITSTALSVAWGDVDGDGDLDLLVGNGGYFHGQPSQLYRNVGGTLTLDTAWNPESRRTVSAAWGDVDSDGDLDLLVGNFGDPNQLYRNIGGTLTLDTAWNPEPRYTTSVAWGDVDGDGDLDLLVGNSIDSNQLYRNTGGTLALDTTWNPEPRDTQSVAWGDVDGDGDLDLLVGNEGKPNQLYRNTDRTLTLDTTWIPEPHYTTSVAWGDVDGDGDLDLLVGNYGHSNQLYRNTGGTLTLDPAWNPEPRSIRSVAWGDVDGDGDLDLVVGNYGQPNQLFRNGGHGFSGLPNNLTSPNARHPVRNANFFATAQILGSSVIPITYTLTDVEGDPVRFIRAYYSPDGGGRWLPAVAAAGTLTTQLTSNYTHTYNWDTFASGFFGQSDDVVFRLEAYPSLTTRANGVPVFQHPYASTTTFPFRVRGTQVRVVTPTITSTLPLSQALVYRLPKNQNFNAEAISDNAGDPFHTDGQGYLQGRGRLDIGDTLVALAPVLTQWRNGSLLFDGVNDYVTIPNNASVNFDAGRKFTLAAWVRSSSSASQELGAAIIAKGTGGGGEQYALDMLPTAFRFFVRNSSGVATVLNAPGPFTSAAGWVHLAAVLDSSQNLMKLYVNGVEKASTTPPSTLLANTHDVSIGGRQLAASDYDLNFAGWIDDMRIYDRALSPAEVAALANDGASSLIGLAGWWRFDEGSGNIAHDQTANHDDGVLNGATWDGGGEQYTVYHTSAAPNDTGLNLTPVLKPGVQVLTVTAANPLMVFNLDVSLEWDARPDQQFLSQLEHDLHVASESLYDWSNGQAALGKVHVYFDREHWDEADVQIYASNRLRPNATQGGIVSDSVVDPITATGVITYEPGQINLGVVWNRYGEANGNLGEDWPKALAHEIGHYALFLDDDYLGLNANKQLIPVDTCTQTAMSDPYRADYSEFHFQDRWPEDCANTLAAQQVGRWDWATITTFYPWLNGTRANAGPSGLPLAVTQIDFIEPITETTVLPAPIFNLTEGGAKIQPGNSARAILYQPDGRLIDLGSPTLDQVNARGARLGDRLCVYDVGEARVGCETITPGDEELALVAKPAWSPDILVSPVTSRTINLEVRVAGVSPALTVKARLYPVDGPATPAITLTRQIPQRVYLPLLLRGSTTTNVMLQADVETASVTAFPDSYVGVFRLEEPAPQGYVQIWVDEPAPRRESIVDYALGGNPAYRHGTGAYRHGTGAYRHGTGAYRHGTGAYRHGTGAPTQSADGQVQIFGDGLVFQPDEFFALQAVNGLPHQPAGTTLVGQGYRLLASAGAPSLRGTSISFYYAGRDVPAGEEAFLSVYFWNGAQWQKLPTELNTDYNVAVAPTQGAGLYALLSSIEIPLYGPGWNPIIYPAQGSQLVTEALASISGSYGIVYGSVLTDTLDPWKVYAVNVPGWVNDLATLEFGKTYWISVTQAITLHVTGGGARLPASLENLPSPPMTVYGPVLAGGGFTPAPNQAVTAWINGQQCGRGTTQVINQQVVYTLNILPDAPGGAVGCGAAGRSLTFQVGARAMSTRVGWDIDRVRNVPLAP